MVVEDSNFDPKSSIDSYLDQKLFIDPSYQIKSWREIAIQQEIGEIYQFGKIIGIGTFGLVREAVPIAAIP